MDIQCGGTLPPAYTKHTLVVMSSYFLNKIKILFNLCMEI